MPIAVIRASLSSDIASPNTNFTRSGFGTPTAAMVVISTANTTSNPEVHGSFSIGFWDGTNSRMMGFGIRDGNDLMNTFRLQNTTQIASVINPISGGIFAAWTISNITDGVQLTMVTDNTTVAYYATVYLFSGSNATAGSIDTNTTQNAPATQALAYSPTLAFFLTSSQASATTTVQDACLGSFGVVVNDGSLTQRAYLFDSRDAGTTSETDDWIDTLAVAGDILDQAIRWTIECTSLDAEIELTTRDGSSGGDVVYYLAVELADNVSLEDLTTPTSTGNDTSVDPGFTPNAVIALCSHVATLDATSPHLIMSLAGADGTVTSGISVRDEDVVGIGDCDGASNQLIVDVRAPTDGSTLIAATVSSFASPITLNYTAVDGTARKGFLLALGEAATSGAVMGMHSIESGIIAGGNVASGLHAIDAGINA